MIEIVGNIISLDGCSIYPCVKYKVLGVEPNQRVSVIDSCGTRYNIDPTAHGMTVEELTALLDEANDLNGCFGSVIPVPPPVTKTHLEPFYGILTNTTTWTPAYGLDAINVTITDPSRCYYIRVTYNCPDGVLGCVLLTPTKIAQPITLKPTDSVTSLVFDVVQPDAGLGLKDWEVITADTPIEVVAEGLDK